MSENNLTTFLNELVKINFLVEKRPENQGDKDSSGEESKASLS